MKFSYKLNSVCLFDEDVENFLRAISSKLFEITDLNLNVE